MSLQELEATREALLRSQAWEQHVRKLDITAICRAGVLEIDDWNWADHEAARRWACGDPKAKPPPKIAAYFRRVAEA